MIQKISEDTSAIWYDIQPECLLVKNSANYILLSQQDDCVTIRKENVDELIKTLKLYRDAGRR